MQVYKNAFMFYNVLLSLMLLRFVSLYSQDSLGVSHPDKTSETNLPALWINGGYFTPEEGLDISEAKAIIINKLSEEGIKGNIKSAIRIAEITTKEAWQNIGVQLYEVKLDYAWLDGIAIIKNQKVIKIFDGMPTTSVFLADLDYDNIYKVYTNYFFGSGIISEEIEGCNIILNENYHLSMRMEKDLKLFIKNGILMAEVKPYDKRDKKSIIQKVALKKIDDYNQLTIE